MKALTFVADFCLAGSPIGASREHEQIQAYTEPPSGSATHESEDGSDDKSRDIRPIANAIKRFTKVGLRALAMTSRARASVGRRDTGMKEHLGALKLKKNMAAGLVRFPARYMYLGEE
ncbi:hypothetical protein CDD83_8113 [Cordyceps sp. RAO-2017]|nr:hypothetical protein CDD83_8113 [Cordyceps sp. RAO-2017]